MEIDNRFDSMADDGQGGSRSREGSSGSSGSSGGSSND
jgi:hypothetical protein